MIRNSKRMIFPIVIILIAVGLFLLILTTKKPPEKKNEETTTPFVSTEIIQLRPLRLTIQSQGLVRAKYNTQLLAQVNGEIIKVSETFVRGGIANKGDLLAQIDPFNYEVMLQQANATLASAKAQFILERAQGQVAEAEWEQITNAKPSELGLRKPQQEQAHAAVKAAEASVKQAEKDLQRTRIIAPFNALITARQVSPGTFVNMGTAIGEVMDIEKAEVRLPVPASDLDYLIDRGARAKVTLSAVVGGKTHQWQAKIVRDEGIVDDKNRMIYLVAEVRDPYLLVNEGKGEVSDGNTQRLSFGTYVTAEIQGRELSAAMSVPRHLLREGKLAMVENEQLHFSEVEVIRHQGKNSIIVDGIATGDQLITSSLAYPVEGMAVKTKSLDSKDDTESVKSASSTAISNNETGAIDADKGES